MPWQMIMLFQNTFASVYALESRVLAQKYKKAHFQILFATFAMVYAVFIVYALLHMPQLHFMVLPQYYGLSVLVGLMFTVSTVLTFITLRYVDAAVGTLLTLLNILAVVVLSSVLIGESLSSLQLGGGLLLMVSIYLIFSTKQTPKHHHNFVLASTLSVIASVCFGLAITGEKYLLNNIGAPTYAIVGIGLQFVPLLLLAVYYNRGEFKHFYKSDFRNRVFVMGLVRGGAGLLFILSLVGANNASLIGALSGFKVILTTLLAAILLKELTFIKKKLLASCVACIGVGMMLW